MTPSRHRLALPEADDIAALLADVIGPAPAPTPAVVAPPPGNGNGRPPADPTRSAADFWGAVNWGNDPGFAGPKPAAPAQQPADPGPRATRLPDLSAASFFGAVNWANDPAKVAAVELLLDPDGRPDPWAAGSYLTTGFVWD